METREKIAVYCCENSGLPAADSVQARSVMSMVDIITLPCSGKSEMGLLLKTLEKEYAGVMIVGCPKDNCQFIRGSDRAAKRVEATKKMLAAIGLDPERVRMEFLSSVDGHKFVHAVTEMRERLKIAVT